MKSKQNIRKQIEFLKDTISLNKKLKGDIGFIYRLQGQVKILQWVLE